ncbi:hypothetical protein B0T26DRAFT_455785 [Lasiosphaeria miniovina]|uniref:Transmembrane protein n=1 Tax=Lasiosphaeria miniovina TaxID=1954250 RepID=A0AA40DMA2_9PEZI|nr:uncharacterized protein B0T26DRAFT_455785 [Lasiosphaeria miniovina]KAK0706461.1 hypothetical protein B0T26DRAFT_455785 [Lasiosphaeria miniovina]
MVVDKKGRGGQLAETETRERRLEPGDSGVREGVMGKEKHKSAFSIRPDPVLHLESLDFFSRKPNGGFGSAGILYGVFLLPPVLFFLIARLVCFVLRCSFSLGLSVLRFFCYRTVWLLLLLLLFPDLSDCDGDVGCGDLW